MTDKKLYTPAEYKAAHKWLESKVSKEGRFFDTFTFVRWAQLFAEYAAEARESSLPDEIEKLRFEKEHWQAQKASYDALVSKIQAIVYKHFGPNERWSDFDVL